MYWRENGGKRRKMVGNGVATGPQRPGMARQGPGEPIIHSTIIPCQRLIVTGI